MQEKKPTCNSFPGALEGPLWPRSSPQWSQFGLYAFLFGTPTKKPAHAEKGAHTPGKESQQTGKVAYLGFKLWTTSENCQSLPLGSGAVLNYIDGPKVLRQAGT